MSDPYDKPSLVGYNSNPPSDDGAVTDSNKLKWETHTDKIGDPLRDYADAINNATDTAFILTWPHNGITEITNDTTVVTGQRGTHFDVTGTTNIDLLPVSTAGEGFIVSVRNNGAGAVKVRADTVAPDTIDGNAEVNLAAGEFGFFIADAGDTWRFLSGSGGSLMNVAFTNVDNLFTEDQRIQNATGNAKLTFESLDTDAGIKGTIDFKSGDSDSNSTSYACIDMAVNDATNGIEDGSLIFSTVEAGTKDQRMEIDCGVTIGDATVVDQGCGTLNVQNGIYIDGVRLKGSSRDIITASGTWINPGVDEVFIRMIGGGAGGGSGYAGSNDAGDSGGQSVFNGDVVVTAGGGSGGAVATVASGASGKVSGGAGGAGVNGDLTIPGGAGRPGMIQAGADGGFAGDGANSPWGQGGSGGLAEETGAQSNGTDATGYGSGGGGGINRNAGPTASGTSTGGGAGAYVEAVVPVTGNVIVTIGNGGAGGNSTGADGGAGAPGLCIVEY